MHGRVQGVFFRDWTVTAASELGVSGWVRNRRDGRVEVQAEGPSDRVEALIARLHDGPPAARVDRIEVETVEPERCAAFHRRPTG